MCGPASLGHAAPARRQCEVAAGLLRMPRPKKSAITLKPSALLRSWVKNLSCRECEPWSLMELANGNITCCRQACLATMCGCGVRIYWYPAALDRFNCITNLRPAGPSLQHCCNSETGSVQTASLSSSSQKLARATAPTWRLSKWLGHPQ